MPKCEFNKVTNLLYWNHPSAWVFSFKFAAYFQKLFYKTTFGGLLLDYLCVSITHACILIKKSKFHLLLTYKPIDTQFNINSIRNKFDPLVFIIDKNFTNLLMISKIQIDSSYLSGHFFTKVIKHIIDYTEMLIVVAFFCI